MWRVSRGAFTGSFDRGIPCNAGATLDPVAEQPEQQEDTAGGGATESAALGLSSYYDYDYGSSGGSPNRQASPADDGFDYDY